VYRKRTREREKLSVYRSNKTIDQYILCGTLKKSRTLHPLFISLRDTLKLMKGWQRTRNVTPRLLLPTNEISLTEWQADTQHGLAVFDSGGWKRVARTRSGRKARDTMAQPETRDVVESYDAFSVGGRLATRSVWPFVIVHQHKSIHLL